MIPCVPGNPAEHHYAHAAERHYKDGVHLYDDGQGTLDPGSGHRQAGSRIRPSAMGSSRRGATHPRQVGGPPVRLSAALGNLAVFATWSVEQRYLDGTAVVAADVTLRRTVAGEILTLHQNALITGVLQ
jgi:hypothetical protein